jgi:hypothetical protein
LAHAKELVEAGDFYKARVRAWAAGEDFAKIREAAVPKRSHASPAAD